MSLPLPTKPCNSGSSCRLGSLPGSSRCTGRTQRSRVGATGGQGCKPKSILQVAGSSGLCFWNFRDADCLFAGCTTGYTQESGTGQVSRANTRGCSSCCCGWPAPWLGRMVVDSKPDVIPYGDGGEWRNKVKVPEREDVGKKTGDHG